MKPRGMSNEGTLMWAHGHYAGRMDEQKRWWGTGFGPRLRELVSALRRDR